MTKEVELKRAQARLAKLEESPKNIKCPGVTRKVRRQVRNLSK